MLQPAALVSVFLLVAVPVLLLMTIWAAVMAMRILFPERPLPFDARACRAAARRREGKAVPVRLQDILDDQRARRAPLPERHPVLDDELNPAGSSLANDLWLRRN